MNRYLLV